MPRRRNERADVATNRTACATDDIAADIVGEDEARLSSRPDPTRNGSWSPLLARPADTAAAGGIPVDLGKWPRLRDTASSSRKSVFEG